MAACGGGGTPQPPPPAERLTLTGTVLDAAGAAIPGADVLLGFAATSTDAAGAFTYGNLLAGEYLVSIQDQQGRFDSRSVTLSETATSFEFSLPADAGGFRVTGVSPRLNASSASLVAPIELEFNAAPDLVSFQNGGVLVSPDIGSLELALEGPVLTITPALQWPLGQQIVVELAGSVQSGSGAALAHEVRWVFRTSSNDATPPVLIAQVPEAGTTGYPPNLSLSLEFNESLAEPDEQLVIAVSDGTGHQARVSGRLLFIDPLDTWQADTAYTVTLTGVADISGNRSAELHVLNFTTGDRLAAAENIQPEWNRLLDEIVFASNRSGNFDIYSIKSDGSDLLQLTSLPGDELHPTLSSDGTTIAFQRQGPGGDWDIFTQENVPDATAEPVTGVGSDDTQPRFSRTFSAEIMFVSDRSDPAGLFMMNSDGSNPTELDQEFGSLQSKPTPHPLLDTQLLFDSSRGGSLDIWRKTISAVDGSVVNQNLTGDSLANEHSPDWGPDAGFFVYISDESGTDNLWLADAAGELPRAVTNFELAATDPSVSRTVGDSRCVLSLLNADGGSDLVMIDLVGGGILQRFTAPEVED